MWNEKGIRRAERQCTDNEDKKEIGESSEKEKQTVEQILFFFFDATITNLEYIIGSLFFFF